MASEKAQEFIALWEGRLPYWSLYDQFLLAFIEVTIGKMDVANKSIMATINSSLQTIYENKSDWNQINTVMEKSLETKSFETLEKINAVLEEQKALDQGLKTMLGIVQYNVLLQKRLETFKEMTVQMAALTMEKIDPKKAQQLFRDFGSDLDFVWKFCEQACTSALERELFLKAAQQPVKKSP